MKLRIVVFIYNQKTDRYLLLNSTKCTNNLKQAHCPLYGKLHEGENYETAIEREIRDQIGLTPLEIFPLNWGAIRRIHMGEFKEMNFLVFVNSEDSLKRNGQWLNLKEFIKQIVWKDNKELLIKVLEKAIKKELYFNKKEREG